MFRALLMSALLMFSASAFSLEMRVKANGTDIGQLLGFNTVGHEPMTIITDKGYVFTFYPITGKLIPSLLFFSGVNCTGSVMTPTYGVANRQIFFDGVGYWYSAPGATATDANAQSYSHNGSCYNYSITMPLIFIYPNAPLTTGFTPPPGGVFPQPISLDAVP